MSDNTERIRPGSTTPQGPALDEVRDQGESASTPGARGRRINTRSEWFWPLVNLIGLVGVVAVNALANIVPFNGLTTGEVVNQDPVYFQPAGFTFRIWILIYVLLAMYVVYSFLPVGRRNGRARRIAPAFLVVNICNAVWLTLWHYEQWTASLVVMSLLFLALFVAYSQLRNRRDPTAQPGTLERLMVWTAFSVYLGWITVALLSNVAVWMDRTGTELLGVGPRWTAVLMMVVALLAAAAIAFFRHDPAYALVVTWALIGIAAEQWDRSKLVSIAAMIGVLLAAAVSFLGSLLAFEQRQAGHVLPTPRTRSVWPGRRRDRATSSEAREDGNRRDGNPTT